MSFFYLYRNITDLLFHVEGFPLNATYPQISTSAFLELVGVLFNKNEFVNFIKVI